MRLSLWYAFILLALCGFTCGNRRPVVYNGLCEDIKLEITWEDGTTSSGTLPSSAAAYLSSPPRYPMKVTITPPDGEAYEITEAKAPGLVGGEVTGPIIGWTVTASGVVPLSEEEIVDRDNRLTPDCSGRGLPLRETEVNK